MKKIIPITYLNCQECKGSAANGHYVLHIEIGLSLLKVLKLGCSSCGWEVDLLATISKSSAVARETVVRLLKDLWPAIATAAKSLPKNKEELQKVVTNPKHPFTAAVLAAFTILAMEMSGFGIFALLTWALGHLVLNPVGWVVIPPLVAVVLANRDRFQKDRIERLRTAISVLDKKLDQGEISRDEYESRRGQLLEGDFSAA